MNNYLTTREACEYYDIGRATLWRWVAKGKINQYKDPRSNRSYYEVIDNNLLSVKETCHILHISRSTLQRRIFKGEISPVSKQCNTLFSKKEIERYLNRPLIKTPSISDLLGKIK